MSISITEFPKGFISNYDDIRNQIQNGDILICSGSGVFSAMIQQATNSIWSHVGLILRLDEIERVMLLESVEPLGVRTVRLSKYLNDYSNNGQPYPGGMAIIRHREFTQKIDSSKLVNIAQYAIDLFGYSYDNDEIAKIAARILASKVPFTKKQMKRIKPDREFICSEYVSRCFERIGIEIRWNQLGFISPADFAADPNFDIVTILKGK